MLSRQMAFVSPLPLFTPLSNIQARCPRASPVQPATRRPLLPRPKANIRTATFVPTCCEKAATPSDPASESPDENTAAPPPQTHVTVEQAHAIEAHALALANGDTHAVARLCADGFVHAFTQNYQPEEHSSLFVVVGSGGNGLVGLYVASALKQRSFEPVVYASEGNKHADVADFCAAHSVPVCDFVPSTLGFYFDVVVDALLGTGFDGGDIHPPFWAVYEMLVSIDLPVACIDLPSGWDLTLGPRTIDIHADTFIKPDLLVSLAVPKLCSTCFAGDFHFVAGRHVPQEFLHEQGIDVPLFPGDDSLSVMLRANAKPFSKLSGEVYARPGTFEATLYTKNPRRTWVDPDDHDDLWDELD